MSDTSLLRKALSEIFYCQSDGNATLVTQGTLPGNMAKLLGVEGVVPCYIQKPPKEGEAPPSWVKGQIYIAPRSSP